MAKPPKLQVIRGSRVTMRRPKGSSATRRVIFTPLGDGTFLLQDLETHYPIRLKWSVELTVPEDAVFVETLE